MAPMEDFQVTVPKKLSSSLVDLFLPPGAKDVKKLQLIIGLQTKKISIRKFATYLNFIDKAFGRLTPGGITTYSKTSKYELKIAEVRVGSWEIIIANLLSDPASIKGLIVVGLLLKYLPGIIKSSLSSYRDYEEGKLARIRRQQIKEQIREDERLSQLAERHIKQLSQTLDFLYRMDIRSLSKARKFSRETVIKVDFELEPSSRQSNDISSEEKRVRKIHFSRRVDLD